MPPFCWLENTASIHDHLKTGVLSSNTHISLHHNPTLCPAWAKGQNLASHFKQQEHSGASSLILIFHLCHSCMCTNNKLSS